MIGKGLLKGLGITFKHTFERDITIQYPEERPFLQRRYRGCLDYDYKRCILCGLCVKTCPNNVLTLDTAKDEGSKKKRLVSFTIDLQYCLFCNLCVEVCPTSTLFFTSDFELSRYQRDEIKKVITPPPGFISAPEQGDISEPEAEKARGVPEGSRMIDTDEEAQAKRQKRIEGMKIALQKNPQKALAKIIEDEGDRGLLAGLLQSDEKKLGVLAGLMIENQEKAVKVAVAFINKARKDNPAQGGE
ncbi:MAG TPA: NADH-quinone oxidoreductase subunit I [Syntrophomonadaceae bacterium]|nr:NADH-quinone oxidoreductase subunit I [Syntrophomonadaceae bacterium]